MSHIERKIEAIVTAIIAEAAMVETRDYLLRGRRFANDSDESVMDLWVRAFVAWVDDDPGKPGRVQSQMDDAAAELGLRNIELPVDRVHEAVDKMFALGRSIDPNDVDLDQAIEDQLRKHRRPN
jgi:hypothetical protein